MEFEIRKADISDWQVVFNLTKVVFEDYQSRFPTMPALLETNNDVIKDIQYKEVLLAYIEEEAVAVVRYHRVDNNFYLSRLGVLEEYRGYQIGPRLLEYVEEQIRLAGGESIILYSPYALNSLIKFYKSLGYKISKIKEDVDYTRAEMVKVMSYES